MSPVLAAALAVYAGLCVGYALALGRGDLPRGATALVMGLALPGVGFVLLWLLDASRRRREEPDYTDFYIGRGFLRDDLRFLQPPDAARDHIPMTEALRLCSFERRRALLLQMMGEEDALHDLDVLREALRNEDTETSHYASVVVMELRRKARQALETQQALYDRDPDEQAAERLSQTLYRVLHSDLYDGADSRRLYRDYRQVSDRLLSAPAPSRQVLGQRIDIERRFGDYTRAQEVCSRYLALYPDSEQAVLAQLYLFIDTKDGPGMREFLRTLSRRPALLTARTLSCVRLFQKEKED